MGREFGNRFRASCQALIPDPLMTVKAIAHWPTQWIWDQVSSCRNWPTILQVAMLSAWVS